MSSDPKGDDPKMDAGVASLDDGESGGGASTIRLVSKDQKEFVVEKKHAFVSTLIKTSLEHGSTRISEQPCSNNKHAQRGGNAEGVAVIVLGETTESAARVWGRPRCSG